MALTVRYWAAARAAAGTAEEQAPDLASLAEAQAWMRQRHGDALARLLPACSYLVDERPAGRREPGDVALAGAAVLEVLPPFAGG